MHLSILLLAALGASPGQSPLVEQIDATGFYQLESPSLGSLDLRHKLVAYWLGQAAIATDPIIYDQLSAYGLREKRLLGALVEDPRRLPADSRAAIVAYAKLFFANRGNHNETTNKKFVPAIGFEAFAGACHAAGKAGAPLPEARALDALLDALRPAMFDPAFEPTPTEKNPPSGKDIVTASSSTFYGPGVTFADVKTFQDAHPLNSRVMKESGRLVEEVYRAGTPDGKVEPGLYAKELGLAIDDLKRAAGYADPAQAKVFAALIRYFQTGDPADWHAFNVLWVQDDAQVDFVNGFIETYRDARAAKGAAEALVSVVDQSLDGLMKKLAANALYFEKKAPWADVYKKLDVKSPVGKAVEALVETGDFGVSTIGDNLPNEEDIHQQYGTKNFLISNAVDVFNRTRGQKIADEFAADPRDGELYAKYGPMADNLMTAMHEIIGHGSGKPRVKDEPRETLREYYSTLEEARADLVAYWNIGDPKLAALGVKDQAEVAHELYRQLARTGLITLNHYPTGDAAEEDHDRDRLLIWNWVRARGGIELFQRGGRYYARIADWKKAHAACGALLAELMRIKGEGDYAAIKALVEKDGIHFDPKVRDDVVKRYQALGLPTYAAGIYADLRVVTDKEGKPVGVAVSYPRDFLAQQLAYARENGTVGF